MRETRGTHVHLIVGPVGSGKSTFALELAHEERALRLGLDEWMTRLFSPDRPASGLIDWYRERAARCVEQIWCVSQAASEVGVASILEIGLIQRSERARFYERVAASGRALTIYLVDAPRELRRERVQERNQRRGQTFSMHVPAEIFELASDLWEPLDDAERVGRDVRVISSAG